MRALIVVGLMFIVGQSTAQIFNPNIEALLAQSSKEVSNLKKFEQLGIKSPGSQSIINTRNWLVQQYMGFGYDSAQVDTFTANGQKQFNIITKKEGLQDDFIVITSHYDTKNGPGANDNGTGICATLEAARLVQNLVTVRTIYFINFSGEEDGFTGSYHFVNNILPSFKGNLYMVINLDQLGGSMGFTGNDKIYCERDELDVPSTNNAQSALLTDSIAMLARLYTNLTPVIAGAYSSDYVPFQEKDYIICGLYQYSSYPFVHTESDSFYRIDTVSFMEATKLAIASTVYFAQVPRFVSVMSLETKKYVSMTSNGDIIIRDLDDDINNWKLNVYDILGKTVFEQTLTSNSTIVMHTDLPTGMHCLILSKPNSDIYWRSLILVP